MLKNYILLILVSVSLSACFDDPFDKYLGYWVKQKVSNQEVIEISKDGDAIFLKIAINEKADLYNRKLPEPTLLKKQEEQLMIVTPRQELPISLSENKELLYVRDSSYKKIDANQFTKIKSNIKAKKETLIKNAKLCKKLEGEYGVKSKVFRKDITLLRDDKKSDDASKNLNELRKIYYDKQSKIPNCRFISAFMLN